MLRTILVTSIRTRGILRAWLPSNILLDLIRTRAGLKWGVPAMLIAAPYLAIAQWATAVPASCTWSSSCACGRR